MSSELIINVTSQETRVALLENGSLAELFIERQTNKGIVGNIYKGKVIKILPGMQAAFVDIGLDRTAFLHATDIYDIFGEDDLEEEVGEEGFLKTESLMIEDLLVEGQEILVQVAKEPIGAKGARITSNLSLPSHYLVFMPTVDRIGVSRRIQNETERKRLKETIHKIKPQGVGFIVRTVAEGKSKWELTEGMEFLLKLWEDIQRKRNRAPVPSLIHEDLSITLRATRDLYNKEVRKVVIDSKEEYIRIKEWTETFRPQLKHFLELYEKDEPIFDAYGIELEIGRALGKKVWLKSGGYIVIEETEALTAIDVNTGRFVGKNNPEDTVLKTNLEAVKEIAYQLRLRNIGGLIIIDFIDMEKEANRERVFQNLKEFLKKDKAKTNILKISELGLVEMTRKRVRENLSGVLGEACLYCEGKGLIKSKATVGYDILRAIKRESPNLSGNKLYVHLNPEVADFLCEEERTGIEELEEELKKRIILKVRKDFHQERFEISGRFY